MARFHLRLSDEEFFTLTPRQFHLLIARHREQTEHEHFLVGLLAATVANYSMGAPEKALVPSDFMPATLARARPRPKESRRAIARNVRCFLMARVEN